LLGAALREREDVDGQENMLLPAVVAELHGFPLIGEKRKVGSHVADFERSARHLRLVHLMGERWSGSRGNQK
jgi:hypothetical protein